MVFIPYELSFIPNAFVLQKDQLKDQSPNVKQNWFQQHHLKELWSGLNWSAWSRDKSGLRVRTSFNFLSKESTSWFIKAAKFHICYDRHHHYLHHNHYHRHHHHHQHNLINIASSLTSGMRKLVSSCIRLAGCFRLLRDRGLCCSSRPPPTPCLPARGGKKCKKKTKKTRHRHKAPM